MFTGIIETLGTLKATETAGSNMHLWVEASTLAGELKIDQSIAHNGVCLTVVELDGISYKVTAVAETLKKTTLGNWTAGKPLNLERGLRLGDRLDGHFVQGHVDTTGICTEKREVDGSWLFGFRFPQEQAALLIEKGSVCINGVSLTVFDVARDSFRVTIIPYTYAQTTFGTLQPGDHVNMEFDVLGKYFLRSAELKALEG